MGESKGPKRLCCPGVDRISQLPDGIIDNILIKMPIADAARTAVLSRKWNHAWISISILKFDSDFSSKTKTHSKLITVIYGILMLHLGPIVGFKLSIICPTKIFEIGRVFHFLSRKGVQELEVCISERGKGYLNMSAGYILPLHFYSCLSLRCLKIANCTINSPCNFGGFRNLNSLLLEYLELNNNMFENFISGCPLLEELKIAHCNFIESSIIKINSSNLKLFDFNGIGSGFRFISAPLLKSLKCISKKYSNYEGVEKSCLKEFCNVLPALESLLVDCRFLQTLEVRNMSSTYGGCSKWLPRLKCLKAKCIRLWNMVEVTSLLGLIGNSPNLNRLHIEMASPHNVDGMENPLRSLEANHLDLFSCKKLQFVTFFGIVDHDSGMDFIKLLLSKSPKLRVMLILAHRPVTHDELLKIQTKVNGFQRASAALDEIVLF